jgi:hypothetical protein
LTQDLVEQVELLDEKHAWSALPSVSAHLSKTRRMRDRMQTASDPGDPIDCARR